MFDPAFLTGTPWAGWHITPVAADASTRRYARLTGAEGKTAIWMDSADTPTAPFVDISRYLTEHGLCAPQILHDAPPHLILSDLGSQDLAQAATTQEAGALYRAAVDVLIKLHTLPCPDLAVLTADRAADMVRITADHYAPRANANRLAAAVGAEFDLLQGPLTLALRDFHVENLIWRADRTGTDRIGLLDFQDAFLAPAGYDLASLLRDVRHDVPDNVVQDMTAYFCAETGLAERDFRKQRALLGAQRNLRILGVFARLIRVLGKLKYAAFMQRTWALLLADLAVDGLGHLRDTILAELPPPTTAGFHP